VTHDEPLETAERLLDEVALMCLHGDTQSGDWDTSYRILPPTPQLLTVMVIGVLVPLTPPP
jgi:hypothetical protein